MKSLRLLKKAILSLCIVLCLGCSTTVKVVNFNEEEFFVQEKNGQKYYCMSSWYMQKVLEAKIKQVNP
jgi:hypothetical protein